jgi:signal recognition particle subunit SRP54
MTMLEKIRTMTGLGRAGAFNPGAKLFAQKQSTGKRLSPKEREKARKEREKEERRKRREQRSQGRDDDGASPVRRP